MSTRESIESRDWSSSALGPREAWAPELRWALQTAFDCPNPVLIAWGPSFLMLYNDAYSSLLGARHPAALGAPLLEVWEDAAERAAPVLQKAFTLGVAAKFEDMLVQGGRYCSYTVSPLRALDGRIGGCLMLGHETTDRLRERARLHGLLMQVPVAITILEGEDPVYTFSNLLNDEVMGRSGMVGHRVRELFPELEAQGMIEIMRDVRESGRPFVGTEVPFRLRTQSETAYFNCILNPFRDGDGKIAGVIAVGADVTAQVQAREKERLGEERYHTLTDALPQMIWTATAAGDVNYANRRCLAYSGATSQEKFGQGWCDMLHGDDKDRVLDAWWLAVREGGAFHEEYRLRGRTGEYRWFLGRAVPVRGSDGRIEYWIGTATDIEEQKHSARAAERANAAKSAFLANMSHEIRTPLGAMLGFSGLLKEPGLTEEERGQYLDTIIRNGNSLTRIIDDILDLAKVEADRLELEESEFSMVEMMADVMRLFDERARAKGITLDTRIHPRMPARLRTDPIRLRQILINIIGNAVKFTSHGGVRVDVDLMEGSRLEVKVTDTGPGVTDEQKQRLFTPFTQADNTTTRRFGGTGLGLALSRRLAGVLGGTLSVTDNPDGRGSVFTVTAKVAVAEATEEIASPAMQTVRCSVAGLNVLLVDDSPDNQELMKEWLTRRGATVEVASDGWEAVQKALSDPRDVILMDIQMPGMDGYEATRVLQARGYAAPIIALTAHAMLEERQKTREAGFAGHVTKPVSFEVLAETILNCLELAHEPSVEN